MMTAIGAVSQKRNGLSADLLAELGGRKGGQISLFANLWPSANECPTESQIRVLAQYLSEIRHNRPCSGHEEAEESRLDWEEGRWILQRLRPSLVMDAVANGGALSSYLEDLERQKRGGAQTTKIIVALDGAPEFRHYCFRRHFNNGVRPEDLIERKDSEFYSLCFYALSLYGVLSIDNESTIPTHKVCQPEKLRTFQDAFVGTILGVGSPMVYLGAAFHLHNALARLNEESGQPWRLRIHARIAMASSWQETVDLLGKVWRGKTGIGGDLWHQFTIEERSFLAAAGIKPGRHPMSKL